MKKNKSLSNFEMHNSSVSSKNAIHKRTKDEEAIYAETSEKIKRGLGNRLPKHCADDGTLHHLEVGRYSISNRRLLDK